MKFSLSGFKKEYIGMKNTSLSDWSKSFIIKIHITLVSLFLFFCFVTSPKILAEDRNFVTPNIVSIDKLLEDSLKVIRSRESLTGVKAEFERLRNRKGTMERYLKDVERLESSLYNKVPKEIWEELTSRRLMLINHIKADAKKMAKLESSYLDLKVREEREARARVAKEEAKVLKAPRKEAKTLKVAQTKAKPQQETNICQKSEQLVALEKKCTDKGWSVSRLLRTAFTQEAGCESRCDIPVTSPQLITKENSKGVADGCFLSGSSKPQCTEVFGEPLNFPFFQRKGDFNLKGVALKLYKEFETKSREVDERFTVGDPDFETLFLKDVIKAYGDAVKDRYQRKVEYLKKISGRVKRVISDSINFSGGGLGTTSRACLLIKEAFSRFGIEWSVGCSSGSNVVNNFIEVGNENAFFNINQASLDPYVFNCETGFMSIGINDGTRGECKCPNDGYLLKTDSPYFKDRNILSEEESKKDLFCIPKDSNDFGSANKETPLSQENLCKMFGGTVMEEGDGKICRGVDKSGTFCILNSTKVFPCRGLFKAVRGCNLKHNRPALNSASCDNNTCPSGQKAVGGECK